MCISGIAGGIVCTKMCSCYCLLTSSGEQLSAGGSKR